MSYSEGDHVVLEKIEKGRQNQNQRVIGKVTKVTGRTVTVETEYDEKTFGKDEGSEWGEGDRHSGWNLQGTIEKRSVQSLCVLRKRSRMAHQ